MTTDHVAFSLKGRRFGPAFDVVELTLEPGTRHRYQSTAWDGALVVVESGALGVVCTERGTLRFPNGSVLFLWGLAVDHLFNDQPEPTVLSAVRRRAHPNTREDSAMVSDGHLDPRFSSPDATPSTWTEVVDRIAGAETAWLTTLREGAPHATPVLVVWHDDAAHFCTGPQEQKAKNMSGDPRCSLLVGDSTFGGTDVTIHGVALRQVDDDRLRVLADAWVAKYGEEWRYEVADGAFRGDGAVAWVFRIEADQVASFKKGDEFAQTIWGPADLDADPR